MSFFDDRSFQKLNYNIFDLTLILFYNLQSVLFLISSSVPISGQIDSAVWVKIQKVRIKVNKEKRNTTRC